MSFEFVPQRGLKPLVLEQTDSYPLIVDHIKLPNSNIQVSLDFWIYFIP